MPSAASAKLEKQASGNQTESSDNNNANTPIRQALVIIEHKIRNLEKRKTKLESYRADQLSGKELSNDQKIAVSKFDEVAQSLEFARELSKQMLQLATAADKEQKKQARREALIRTQAETFKIREVLIIQNILSTFLSDQQIREDFLNGTNGAAKLEEDDLNILEKFYVDVHVKRQNTPEDVPFSVGAQKAAEYLSLTIDGRPKQYGETTFDNVRRILTIIQESGYLDKSGKINEGGGSSSDIDPVDESPAADNEQNDNQVLEDDKTVVATSIQDNVENIDAVNSNMPKQQQLQQPSQSQQQQQQHLPPPQQSIQPSPPQNIGQQIIEAPSAAAVPAPSFPQQPQQQQQPPQQPTLVNTQIPSQAPQMTIPVVQTQIVPASVAQAPQVAQGHPTAVQPNPASVNPLHAGHFPPTTVRAVEQAYFKQHQYIQQMRPLAEVIGSGNFFFLQDSELDSPDLVPTVGFTPNEGQNQNQSSIPTAPTSSSTVIIPSNQPTIPQQQTQTQSQQQQAQQSQLPTMQPQPGGIPQQQQQQQKSQQAPPLPASAPIPTQTFTNQSFPPIVPPPNAAIFPPQVVQNPNEIPSSQPQIPAVFTSPQLPIQMVTPGGVATIQQQSIVVSVPAPSVVTAAGTVGSSQNSATVLKSIENQQQQHQGIIAAQQQALLTGPSGANVPLPGFTAAVPTKFPPVPTPPMASIHQDNYEKLQKQSQKNVLNESQIHHKKIDDIIVKDRSDVQNDWNANENLPKQQRMPKKEEESNQWSNEMANVKSNEWNNTTYDSHQTSESNNWNSGSNQNESGSGGYASRGRNSFGNRTGGGGGGNRGMRGNGSGGNNGGGPSSGGPPSNGYRGGGRSNNYQQQQQQSNHRNSGLYFRNNESTGSGNSGSGYYQNHQNGGYNSGPSGKQDNGSSNYAGGNINTSFRPRGGPMPSNRQQSAGGNGGGTRSSGGGPSNSGGPQPQRNSMNANRPPNAAGMSVNTNRPGGGGGPRATGNYGTSRPPPNVRQHQHQPQQDVNV